MGPPLHDNALHGRLDLRSSSCSCPSGRPVRAEPTRSWPGCPVPEDAGGTDRVGETALVDARAAQGRGPARRSRASSGPGHRSRSDSSESSLRPGAGRRRRRSTRPRSSSWRWRTSTPSRTRPRSPPPPQFLLDRQNAERLVGLHRGGRTATRRSRSTRSSGSGRPRTRAISISPGGLGPRGAVLSVDPVGRIGRLDLSPRRAAAQETVSMTAAGVGSLLICDRQLAPYRTAVKVGQPAPDPARRRGRAEEIQARRRSPADRRRRSRPGSTGSAANFTTTRHPRSSATRPITPSTGSSGSGPSPTRRRSAVATGTPRAGVTSPRPSGRTAAFTRPTATGRTPPGPCSS